MVGTQIVVQSYDLDGSLAREWPSTVEQSLENLVVVFSRRGTRCSGPKGGWDFQMDSRTYFWYQRGFNLIELYSADGTLQDIYVHVASRPELHNGVLKYTDYELDVVQHSGDIPRLVDVDEFHSAIERLALPIGFQSECYGSVSEAFSILAEWKWS